MKRSTILTLLFLVGLAVLTVVGKQLILGRTINPVGQVDAPKAAEFKDYGSNPLDQFSQLQEGKDYTLEDKRYFEDDVWLVTTVQPVEEGAAEPATAVLKKGDDGYKIVLGPGTSFGPKDLTNLPKSVVDYLRSINRTSDADAVN